MGKRESIGLGGIGLFGGVVAMLVNELFPNAPHDLLWWIFWACMALIALSAGLFFWPTKSVTPAAQGHVTTGNYSPIVTGERPQVAGRDIHNSTVNIGTSPEVHLSDWEHEVTPQGHRYRRILTVQTEYAVPRLRVSVQAPSIQTFEVRPQVGGVYSFGHTGQRGDVHFTTLQNAAGKYRLEVVTTKAETVACDVGLV